MNLNIMVILIELLNTLFKVLKLVNLTKEQIKEWNNIKHTIMYEIAL